MPRGRQTLREYLQKCLERVERVPDDEPWSQIRFPRQEAKKNISNVKNRKRIVIGDSDPQQFSEFHAIWEAWALYCGDNPTLRKELLIAAMRDFDVKGWLEDHAEDKRIE